MAQNLGDKLHRLATLAPADVQAIEGLVDFRIAQQLLQERIAIQAAASIRWPRGRLDRKD